LGMGLVTHKNFVEQMHGGGEQKEEEELGDKDEENS